MWSRFLIVGKGWWEKLARGWLGLFSIFDFAYVDILDYSEAYDYFNYSNDAYVDYLVEYLGIFFSSRAPIACFSRILAPRKPYSDICWCSMPKFGIVWFSEKLIRT